MFKKITTISTFLSALFLFGCMEQETAYVHVGPNWNHIQKLEASKNPVKVTASVKQNYLVGDAISVEVTSAEKGNLWVVYVDPNDEVALLYPNDHVKDNAINAGETKIIPTKDTGWEIQAAEPVGQSIVAFIVTTNGADLRDVLGKKKDGMEKALTLIKKDATWGISKHVINVTAAN